MLAATGASAQRTSPLPLCSTTCNVWSPCEINLSTTNGVISEANLYVNRLTATVTQTSGGTDSRVIPGFYFDRTSYGSGLATFKIRYTPVSAGNYSYTTSSSLAGLNAQTGTFTCSAAVNLADGDANPGFLRRDASNPYSFVWDNTSLSVTHPFLWGQTYYQIVNQARRNTDSDATWHTAVTNAKSSSMKKIRLLVAPWNEAPFTDATNTHAQLTEPFCTGTSTTACEVTGGALDFTRVDLDHYQALDKVVKYLFDNGIVAEIIIFRDTGLSSMFSSVNDQNKQYLRYVIARYAAFENVTWSLSNEWQNADYTGTDGRTNWNILGNCVASGCLNDAGTLTAVEHDPWITGTAGKRALTIHPAAKHPSGTGAVVGNCFSFFDQTWPANGSLQYGLSLKTSTQGYESIACNRRTADTGSCPGGTVNRNIPFTNDEYGYIGDINVKQNRDLMWGIVTGGGFGTTGDNRASTTGCPSGYVSPCGSPIQSTIWSTAGQYTDISNMVNFVTSKSIPFWTMSPLDTCPEADSIHTLGIGGTSKKYLVSFDQEGTSPAGQVPGGNYSAAWYNAKDNVNVSVACASYSTGALTSPPAGAPACSAAPCDWVVYLIGC